GFLAVLFAADFVGNLIPIGYSDGTMLLHLLLWSEKGKDLCRLVESSKSHADAAQKQLQGDFAGEVEDRKRALEQVLKAGKQVEPLAVAYQAVGFAQINAGMKMDAIDSLKKCIEVLETGSGIDPLIEANAWYGLVKVYQRFQIAPEMEKAYEAAVRLFEKAK